MDCISIKNLEVFSKQNVFDAGNSLGQKFAIDMGIFFDTKKASLSDDIDKSIDYDSVCHFINAFIKGHNFRLIETLAQRLAEDILIEYPTICEIVVTVKKPWAPVGLPIEEVAVTIKRAWHTVYLGMGSNMGDREEYINKAIKYLKENYKIEVVKATELIETKPYGLEQQDKFLNNVVKIRTLLDPLELLVLCKNIEKMLGRVKTEHWGPRPIDIDILFYDDLVIDSEDLVVPHEDMKNRVFVLEPMMDIAPYLRHPVFNKTIKEMYTELLNQNSN